MADADAQTKSFRIEEKDGEFCVMSEDGSRSFGCYPSEEKAKERLKEVEAFKHMNPKDHAEADQAEDHTDPTASISIGGRRIVRKVRRRRLYEGADPTISITIGGKRIVRRVRKPRRAVYSGDWDEAKHPRDENGRFGSGGGGSISGGGEAGGSGTPAPYGIKSRNGFTLSDGINGVSWEKTVQVPDPKREGKSVAATISINALTGEDPDDLANLNATIQIGKKVKDLGYVDPITVDARIDKAVAEKFVSTWMDLSDQDIVKLVARKRFASTDEHRSYTVSTDGVTIMVGKLLRTYGPNGPQANMDGSMAICGFEFDKSEFSLGDAIDWMRENQFWFDSFKSEEDEDTWCFKIRDEQEFQPGSIYYIDAATGDATADEDVDGEFDTLDYAQVETMMDDLREYGEWDESKHPRDKDGKFAGGAGGDGGNDSVESGHGFLKAGGITLSADGRWGAGTGNLFSPVGKKDIASFGKALTSIKEDQNWKPIGEQPTYQPGHDGRLTHSWRYKNKGTGQVIKLTRDVNLRGEPVALGITVHKESRHEQDAENRARSYAEGDPVLKDISGVEIFRTGKWNGDTYNTDDLDAMVEAFDQVGFVPPVKLGHKEESGAPAYGWVKAVRRVGEKLVADFKDISQNVYDLIKGRGYDSVSSEIFWDLDRNGKKYKRVLKAVALLGGEIPAVAGLAPLRTVVASLPAGAYGRLTTYTLGKGDWDMEKIAELDGTVKELTQAKDKAEAQAKEMAQKVAALEQEIAASKERERGKLIAEKTGNCSIPALRPYIAALYDAATTQVTKKLTYTVADKAEESDAVGVLDKLVGEMNNLSKKLFTEQGVSDHEPRKDEPDNVASGPNVHQKVVAYQAKHGIKSYEAALKAVLAENPDLKRHYAKS